METATSIELFVEILDRYVYYFDQGNEAVSNPISPPFPFRPHPTHAPYLSRAIPAPAHHTFLFLIRANAQKVTTKYVNGLIELIHSNLAGSQGDSGLVEHSRKHFHRTLENIRSRGFEGLVLYPS